MRPRSENREGGRERPEAKESRQEKSSAAGGRGWEAEKPREIPKAGWLDIGSRVKEQIQLDNLSIVAAGVAFFLLLGLFPALAATVSVYGLVADPATVQEQVSSWSAFLPEQVHTLLEKQMERIAGQERAAGWGLGLGIFLALLSSSKAMKALVGGLNIAYDERETRGFFKVQGLTLLLTLVAVVTGVLAIGLIVALPPILNNIGLGGIAEVAVQVGRWLVLIGLAVVGLGVLYRYGPSREKPRWRWVSWGSGMATVLWLLGSVLFSIYVTNFGSYNKTYGSIGAVVILMMWFYLTAFCALLGAEINAEIERQTRRDTTVGKPERMGRRDAHAADTLGETRQARTEAG